MFAPVGTTRGCYIGRPWRFLDETIGDRQVSRGVLDGRLLAVQRRTDPSSIAGCRGVRARASRFGRVIRESRIERLEENAAATAVALTDAEQRRIAGVLAERTVAGSRYPAAGMATVNA